MTLSPASQQLLDNATQWHARTSGIIPKLFDDWSLRDACVPFVGDFEFKGQAETDLRKKVKLERALHRKLRALDQEIARTYTEVLARTGTVIDMESRAFEPLTSMLRGHYHETSGKFDSLIRVKLPADVSITAVEEARISTALSTHFDVKAREQANLILRTHQKNAIRATELGMEAAAAEGIAEREAVARISGRILDRKFVGREQGISVLETLHPAEASKLTEAEVLSGSNGLTVLGETPDATTHKVWTTQGDHRVRVPPQDDFDHVLADEQRVPLNEAFEVSGESLPSPGDTSLGASIGNVARCRCAVRYDVEEITEVRRRAA